MKSGANFDIVEFEVLATLEEGMVVSVVEGVDVGGVGKTISIKVNGAQQTVQIEIIAEDGKIIETLSFPASDQGAIDLPWLIPKDTAPGIYTISVTDAFNSAETTYLLE